MVGKAAKSQHGTRVQNFSASTRSSRLHDAMSMAGLKSSTTLPRFPTATSMPRLNRASSANIVKRVPSANDGKKTQRVQNAKKAENGKKAQSAASLIRELAMQFDAELAEPRVGAGGPIDIGTTGIGVGVGVEGAGGGGSRESTRVGDVDGVDDVASSGANSAGQLGGEDEVDEVENEVGGSSEMDIEMQLTEGISTASITKKVNGTSHQNRTRSRSGSDRVSPTKEKENKVVGSQDHEEMPRSQASQESFQFQLLTQPPYRSPQSSQRSIR
ncbi:uncharacterized protein STEHIDRAFT_150469 [Stereum hirsutum FP-91666 SS1]|uniref:uncharacterized protein n=1 Tax=Stereum hirsutum (strain FP-91666) TaxID=721885 RepID=UPI000444A63F|nr:uncharacterized protein STEHIDRAFT_150469 [Stereum hirsutum FP-91666 SS1]EIM80804.1 hypothetical protein STEHIDRAFT_150469 [Stereum hirsutum FP-91666 SS1]